MKRVFLGSWTCPSGNNVNVFLGPSDEDPRPLAFEWDDPPPFKRADDDVHYRAVILPAVAGRVREYLEQTGTTLVLRTW